MSSEPTSRQSIDAGVEPAERPLGETGSPSASKERKPRMEQAIEFVASGLGNGVTWLADRGVLLAIFAVAWAAVGAGILLSQSTVDEVWRAIGQLPVYVQAIVWLLFLPVMLGLWVWEAGWPLLVRAALVVILAAWNLLILLPRGAQGVRP